MRLFALLAAIALLAFSAPLSSAMIRLRPSRVSAGC